MKEINEKLRRIQQELVAPKTKFNSFGNYNYRSAEDILLALKPLLNRESLVLTLSDDIVNIGDFNYIKTTAKLTDGQNEITATGFAREDEHRAGMSESQMTGCASSYARKYALNGLFLIDDGVDADTFDNRTQNNGQNRALNNGNGTGVQQRPTSQKMTGFMANNGQILKDFCANEKNNPETDREELLRFFNYYEKKVATWNDVLKPEYLWKRWINNAQNKRYEQAYQQEQNIPVQHYEGDDDNLKFSDLF